MELLSTIQEIKAIAEPHLIWGLVVLGAFIVIQWVAIQYLMLQIYFLNEEVKKPHPDLKRLQRYDFRLKNIENQADTIFEKLAQQREEIRQVARDSVSLLPTRPSAPQRGESHSFESSFVSMAEINLKKRLDALSAPRPGHS